MSYMMETRYGKGNEIDGIISRLHHLLTQHAEKLASEGLTGELEIITGYVEQCAAGKLEYSALVENIGLDILQKARQALKETADDQKNHAGEAHKNNADDYLVARKEISNIIGEILASNELS